MCLGKSSNNGTRVIVVGLGRMVVKEQAGSGLRVALPRTQRTQILKGGQVTILRNFLMVRICTEC